MKLQMLWQVWLTTYGPQHRNGPARKAMQSSRYQRPKAPVLPGQSMATTITSRLLLSNRGRTGPHFYQITNCFNVRPPIRFRTAISCHSEKASMRRCVLYRVHLQCCQVTLEQQLDSWVALCPGVLDEIALHSTCCSGPPRTYDSKPFALPPQAEIIGEDKHAICEMTSTL